MAVPPLSPNYSTDTSLKRPENPPSTQTLSNRLTPTSSPSRSSDLPNTLPLYLPTSHKASKEPSNVLIEKTPPEAIVEAARRILQTSQTSKNIADTHKGFIDTLGVVYSGLMFHPRHAELFAIKASCHLGLGSGGFALEAVTEALEIDPENETALALVEHCLSMAPSPAPYPFSIEDTAFPNIVTAFLSHETPAQACEEAANGLNDALSLLKTDPQCSSALSIKLICLIIQENLEECTRAFVQIPLDIHPKIASNISHILSSAESALRKNPLHRTALLMRMACLTIQGNQTLFLAHYEALPNAAANSEEKNLNPLYKETIEIADCLLKQEPKNLMALASKAEALTNLDQFNDAYKIVKSGLELHPNSDMLLALLAKCDYHTNARTAILHAMRALEINNKNLFARLILIHCLLKVGTPQQILNAALQAAEFIPQHPLVKDVIQQYLP